MMKKQFVSSLIYFTLFVNLFDILIHVISGQPEALRITGNLLIIVSGILLIRNARYQLLYTVSLCLYILLNTVFIVLNGVGTLGVVLIAATILSGLYIVRRKQEPLNTQKLKTK